MEISIDATYKCLFACKFCSTDYDDCLNDIDFKVAEKILKFIDEMSGAKHLPIEISITGGEPLMISSLSQFINLWFNKRNHMTLCSTAAIEFNKEYWCCLKASGLKTVRLSMHTVSREQSLSIYGSAYDLNIVDQNIDYMLSADLEVVLNYVLSQLNQDSFEKVANYCKKKGIGVIRVLGLSQQGRAVNNWNSVSLYNHNILCAIDEIKKISLKYGISTVFSGLPSVETCTHSNKNGKCLGGMEFFHINSNGDIYPCPSMKSKLCERIGSVLNEKFIEVDFHDRYCLNNNNGTQTNFNFA